MSCAGSIYYFVSFFQAAFFDRVFFYFIPVGLVNAKTGSGNNKTKRNHLNHLILTSLIAMQGINIHHKKPHI